MKITKRQLKQIIREEYSRLKCQGLIIEHGPFHGGHEGRGSDMPLPTPRYNNKGYGWHDFKMMASEGDWEGCSDWLEEYCLDRGIRIDSEMIQHMCEYGSDETVTARELEDEMQALSQMY